MGKKVFVSGISGQDGSYMVEYLLKNVSDVEVYGGARRLSVNNHENFEHIKDSRFRLVDFDLTDPYNIQKNIQEIQPDYFINFAAQSFVGSSWDNPALTFQVNTMGVLYILEAIRKLSPKTRLYQAGSSEEFGDVVTVPQDETHPLRPRSPYGASKASARHLVKVYRESYDLYAVQGYLFNHESERRGIHFVTRKITSNVARIRKAINVGEQFDPIELGNLDTRRDWSHAEDFVDGIWRMLNQDVYKSWDGKPKDYVLSSNKTHSIKEFVERAFWEAGISGQWQGEGMNLTYLKEGTNLPLVVVNKDFYRPAEVDLLLGDSTKVREDLSWDPQVSFDDLVRRMVKSDLQGA